jgi:hypothetical protein
VRIIESDETPRIDSIFSPGYRLAVRDNAQSFHGGFGKPFAVLLSVSVFQVIP